MDVPVEQEVPRSRGREGLSQPSGLMVATARTNPPAPCIHGRYLGDAPCKKQPARCRQCPGLSLPSRINSDVTLAEQD